ncbi:MAG TPA: hypothetical protein EYP90_12270 [Chromatiaceae bacterium]|nr:hypothetical protein [Chromatiaceae bacterium]
MTISESGRSAIERAQLQYRQELPAKADELQRLHQAYLQRRDLDCQQLLLRQTHRLSGSAGMYELPHLSQLARAAHHQLRDNPDDATAALTELLDAMRKAAGG